MPLNNREKDIILIKKALIIILIIACFFECIYYPTFNSFLLSCTSLISLLLFNKFIFKLDVIQNSPIAFFAFSNLTLFMYLPIPVTLLDGNSADHTLKIPEITFSLQFLYYIIALAAFYLAFSKSKVNKSRLVWWLYNKRFFPTPTTKTLWVLGFIGCIPRFILLIANLNIGAGFLSIISFFMYSPLIILFKPLIGGRKTTKSQKIAVILYFIAIIILLIGTNGRHYLITPIIIVLGCYFISYFQDLNAPSILTLKNIILSIIIFLLISGPISNLATAMVMVRDVRGDISFNQLITETLTLMNDTKAIKDFNMTMKNRSESSSNLDWDEYYVSNVFLERFCNYRVVDASIYHSIRLGWINNSMIKKITTDILELPPSPIPQIFFGLEKSKKDSPMDILYHLSSREPLSGGLRVGGDVGLGLSIFGIFYFLIELLVYYAFFRILNCLFIRKQGKIIISFFILIQFLEYFNSFTVHSGIVRHIGFIIWNFWWTSFVLIITYRIVTTLFIAKKSI